MMCSVDIPGGLPFSEGKWRKSGLKDVEDREGLWRMEGGKSEVGILLYERRINKYVLWAWINTYW